METSVKTHSNNYKTLDLNNSLEGDSLEPDQAEKDEP